MLVMLRDGDSDRSYMGIYSKYVSHIYILVHASVPNVDSVQKENAAQYYNNVSTSIEYIRKPLP